MKYMVIVDEVSVLDKNNSPHIELGLGSDAVTNIAAVPIFKPIMVSDNGRFVYMDQEHIDVLIDYERIEALKSLINRIEQTSTFEDAYKDWKKFIKTPIPFEQVNTNAICILKCCDTCKHKDKLMTQEPCFSCETKNGWYEKWEAKEND